MNECPRIAVMIPTLNEAKNIRACLRSLLSQTIRPAQIIICDQGSVDQTKDLASTMLSESDIPFVIVSEARNPSLGKWNISFAYWKASQYITENVDFVACLEADIVLAHDYYENILKVFSNRYVGMACGALYPFGFPKSPFPLPEDWRSKNTWGGNRVYSLACWLDLTRAVDLRLFSAWDTDHNVLAALRRWRIVQVREAHSYHPRAINPSRGVAKGIADRYQGYPFWFVLQRAFRDMADLPRLVGYTCMTFWRGRSPIQKVYRGAIYARLGELFEPLASRPDGELCGVRGK